MKSCEDNTKHDIVNKAVLNIVEIDEIRTQNAVGRIALSWKFLQPHPANRSRFQPQWRCKHVVALRRRNIRHLCMSVLYLSVMNDHDNDVYILQSFKHAFPRGNCGDLNTLCLPCQALAATPIDKISLRSSVVDSSDSFRSLLKAGTTSRRVAFLKTCDRHF